jgi:ABC-type nitrate/sulfonate/bicarbonate transport system ATPase subunit
VSAVAKTGIPADPGGTTAFQVEGLDKVFSADHGGSEVVALDAVDLEVGAGEFVSIVGPSGCGKSTLLDLLAGLLEPTRGRILLDGKVPGELLGQLGYMQQRDLLMPWRSVLDNTILGLELGGVGRDAARARARQELERFGLTGFEDAWPAALSGGMRQRAALLRTFLAGRDALLLDEPFGALDALTRAEMQRWLLEVWGADRKTILLVTHDVDEAILLSDRVYVMSPRPGRVALEVTVELPRPRVADLAMTPEFAALKQRLLVPLTDATGLRAVR